MSNYNSFEELNKDLITGNIKEPSYFIPPLDMPNIKQSFTSIRNDFIGENENLNPYLKRRLDTVLHVFMNTTIDISYLYTDRNYAFGNRYEYIIDVYDKMDYVLDTELLDKLLDIIHNDDLAKLDMLLYIVETRHNNEMFMKIVNKVLNNELKYIYFANTLCNLTYVMKCMKYYKQKEVDGS